MKVRWCQHNKWPLSSQLAGLMAPEVLQTEGEAACQALLAKGCTIWRPLPLILFPRAQGRCFEGVEKIWVFLNENKLLKVAYQRRKSLLESAHLYIQINSLRKFKEVQKLKAVGGSLQIPRRTIWAKQTFLEQNLKKFPSFPKFSKFLEF